jgi:multiple antibiotic resistance protein
LASLFIGAYVLDFFGLSVPVVQVGGGLVVCANAWALLRRKTPTPNLPVRTPSAVEIATRAFYR